MSTEQTRGWFWPTQARKAHFDRGDGRALCGKWARINPLSGAAAPFQGDAASPASKDDCVACRRALDAESGPGFALSAESKDDRPHGQKEGRS
jgi:hypothetical protein